MTSFSGRLLSFGLFALLAACSGSGSSTTTDSDPLCARQRDNELRCNPTQSACARQADYNDCIATKSLYRPELTTAYLSCYPATLGCDTAAHSQAQSCAQTAASKVAVSATLMTLINNLCQRCPSAANQSADAMACMTSLTNNASDLGLTLRYYTDDTLSHLNTCLVGASPPADGCVAFGSCLQSVVPTATAGACADGGT